MTERYDLRDPEQSEKGITAAIAALRDGDLVVVPTDTVYGVAAEAFDHRGVAKLLRAKDRGRDVPPPILIGTVYAMEGLADDLDDNARELVERFWPGPLSLIVKQQHSLTWDLGETRGTVMLRMPDHEETLQLLRRTGPLAVSSANRHGRPPATSVGQAQAELGDRVAVYLDGGETPGPVPSTIVDLTRIVPQLLRRGGVSEEQLRTVLPSLEVDIDGEEIEVDPETAAKLAALEADLANDAAEPDAAEPDAAEPDAAEPDAAEPDAAEPEAEQPARSEPGRYPEAAAPADEPGRPTP